MNKVVFFAEFTHLRRHRSVISGCEFQKLAHCPAPRQLLPVRQRLIEAGHAGAHHRGLPRASPAPAGPHSPADLAVFSADELHSIDNVLDQLAGMTATQVSQLCHLEPGWRLTELGETIPFATAFLDFPQVDTLPAWRLSREVAERYGLVNAS